MMKRLGTRVNLIPVIAKADTMTQEDLLNFKHIVRSPSYRPEITADWQIREVVSAQNIKIYSPPIDPEEPAAAEHAQALQAVMPFSIIGSTDDVTTADGRTVKGREYLWGVAEGQSAIPVSGERQADE
jgi:cell division control protein 12